MKKHSVTISGHATSISLEEPFWDALKEVAARENLSLAKLIERIDGARISPNLSSAIRIYTLRHFRKTSG